ncbi:hypothetical protein B0I35DRAFT_101176 [Stachybotrys elegans]|uniref:Uncharacterized protein n=1 Tax=Stachybotrys elegans TaxID=80388 RepID=A0A8K0SEU2_9HYPO|nr:hypothetical protein B0I35DRAFT_101176 [Stachybotrys elegans]
MGGSLTRLTLAIMLGIRCEWRCLLFRMVWFLALLYTNIILYGAGHEMEFQWKNTRRLIHRLAALVTFIDESERCLDDDASHRHLPCLPLRSLRSSPSSASPKNVTTTKRLCVGWKAYPAGESTISMLHIHLAISPLHAPTLSWCIGVYAALPVGCCCTRCPQSNGRSAYLHLVRRRCLLFVLSQGHPPEIFAFSVFLFSLSSPPIFILSKNPLFRLFHFRPRIGPIPGARFLRTIHKPYLAGVSHFLCTTGHVGFPARMPQWDTDQRLRGGTLRR